MPKVKRPDHDPPVGVFELSFRHQDASLLEEFPGLLKEELNQEKKSGTLFEKLRFFVILGFTKEKEVFMTSTEYSWKPAVGIA
ncbi:MAG: hypothetical protein JWP27_598 [Flaviaesturariibacter sp.]|nr:hypothetical protein [Flaviaesturariibacter sp.]